MLRAMRGTGALVAWLAYLAGPGCGFTAPRGVPEDAPGDAAPDDGPADAPPDAPDVPACVDDPSYTTHGGTGHRYKALSGNTIYDTAIDRCAADGAHLAVVDTAAENAYLAGFITNEAWIGFDDLTEEGVFRWITGAPTDFIGFTGDEPNDANGEDCTYLRPNGTWNDIGCEDNKRPLCECAPAYQAPPTPACRTATTGFIERSGRRVFARPAMTWQEAKADCEAIGAHLLVIGDATENTEMDGALTAPHWIGYTDAVTEGTFRWVNGAPSTYNSWPGSTAPAEDDLDCAVLQDGGAWASVDCGETHLSACECDPLPP